MNRCPYCGNNLSRQLFIGFGAWGSPRGGWHQHWGHGWGWGHHGWGGGWGGHHWR